MTAEVTTKTPAERIAEQKIRMSATPTHRPPPRWASGMHGWRCVLYRPDEGEQRTRTLTIQFWMGPALNHKPTAAEVLDALASDAAIAENCRDAAEFAREMGYEEDREAERAYRSLKAEAARTKRFLGSAYDDWLFLTERL